MSADTLPPLRPVACPVPGGATESEASLPRLWLRRLRTRRAIAALHPEQIRDAGLDPLTVRTESLKPFWRA